MKGPTLFERIEAYDKALRNRLLVFKPPGYDEWVWECWADHHDGDCFVGIMDGLAPTHADALAAANRHALEHLGEDTAKWAADEFAVGSEVWQEDQQ